MKFVERDILFPEPLIPVTLSKGRRQMLQTSSHPGKIIKFLSPTASEWPDERISLIENGWKELGTYSGVYIPAFETVAVNGKNFINGRQTERDICLIKDLIDGETVDDITMDGAQEPEFQSALRKLLCGLTSYNRDKLKNGGWVVTDQKLEQYVWGLTPFDRMKKMYFVDLDCFGAIYDPKKPHRNRDTIRGNIEWVRRMAEQAEQKFAMNLSIEITELNKLKGEVVVN
jgi:hypothetical protein